MKHMNEAQHAESSSDNTKGGQMGSEVSAQQVINDLSTSVWAFSVLVSAVEAGMLELLAQPTSLTDLSRQSAIPVSLAKELLDTLVAAGLLQCDGEIYSGAPTLLPLLQAPFREALFASIRSMYLQSRQFINDAKSRRLTGGWFHTDPEILVAQGLTGAPGIAPAAHGLFPHLPGLLERLHSPTATFLDVGTGVATIAIELCRLFPSLHAVGLEPQSAPLVEARRAVSRAGLENRIELRAQRIEDLTERDAFDLIWFPQMFMPRTVVEQGLHAARTALRPGGWIWLSTFITRDMDLSTTLGRLRTLWWGGELLYPEQVVELLSAANFRHTRVIVPPAGSGVPAGTTAVVGQR